MPINKAPVVPAKPAAPAPKPVKKQFGSISHKSKLLTCGFFYAIIILQEKKYEKTNAARLLNDTTQRA